ncbi:MAG: ABC transporter ATP-binding protein [Eubacteriales bacterium]|nr:ABC transporter ATP-binding protein [Eubacteriales bacterium]
MGENALTVRGLCKSYKDFSLKEISFTLPKGYIMGYVGRNGAGKTTTLGMIAHLIKADGGVCTIDGINYKEQPVAYKEAIGYIGDSDGFMPDFKLKHIRTVCRDFYPTFREQEFDAYMKKWKLPENKKIKEFSRGMKVKLMFAMALCRDTKLLILDEATNGLDPMVRQEILEILQEYIADGERSVLFSTHILSDLEQIADYVFFIHNGAKVFCETKEELQEEYMIVKGGREDLDGKARKYMIGLKETGVGFEAVIKSDDAAYLSRECVFEKPSIDNIVIHMIREMEEAQ